MQATGSFRNGGAQLVWENIIDCQANKRDRDIRRVQSKAALILREAENRNSRKTGTRESKNIVETDTKRILAVHEYCGWV